MQILRSMLPILLILLGVYATVCLAMFFIQDRLVYYPDTSAPGPPPGPNSRDVELLTRDGLRLHAWLFEAPAARGALLFCHGNGGHLGHRYLAARGFVDMGLTVLLFDYRGYGGSEGRPTEDGTYLDAEAAYDHLVGLGFASDRIAVYGESLGGAVALELACRRELACVVSESTFSSIPDIAASIYPWLPVRTLARVRYDNKRKVGRLKMPLLLIHSPEDELVTIDHAERLRAAARAGTELLRTAGGHNDGGFFRRPEWTERVRAFLHAALPTP